MCDKALTITTLSKSVIQRRSIKETTMLNIIFFAFLLFIARGQSTETENCQTGWGAQPLYSVVEGCETLPCNLAPGQEAVINVVFEAPHTIRDMRTVARVTFGFTFNYTGLGDYEKTCNYLENTYCPILKGEMVQYELRMPIEEWFPEVSVSVQFMVEDFDTRLPIFCLLLRIQVVNPNNRKIAHMPSNVPSEHILKELAPKHLLKDTVVLKPPQSN